MVAKVVDGRHDGYGERIAALEVHNYNILRILKSFEEKYDDGREKLEQKMDDLRETIAEYRGAAKIGRWVTHVLAIAAAGGAGTIGGKLAAAAKIAESIK